MSDQIAKIRVKVGSVEVEYEGNPIFLDEGLTQLLDHMAHMSKSMPTARSTSGAPQTPPPPSESSNSSTNELTLSTSSIAARIGGGSGPDLAICAMAHLELVKGETSYERRAILEEMKNAKGYYKANMSGNNAANITGLVKAGRANEIGTGKYCLNASERQKIEAALAGST